MNQAVDLDELTLFRDMARRAFEQEITPHYEAWEEERMVPRTLWNRLGEAGPLHRGGSRACAAPSAPLPTPHSGV